MSTVERDQAIREQYAAGASQKRLAREYGLSQPTISRVVSGTARTNVAAERLAKILVDLAEIHAELQGGGRHV